MHSSTEIYVLHIWFKSKIEIHLVSFRKLSLRVKLKKKIIIFYSIKGLNHNKFVTIDNYINLLTICQ